MTAAEAASITENTIALADASPVFGTLVSVSVVVVAAVTVVLTGVFVVVLLFVLLFVVLFVLF